jgi:hypothetical protein
MTRSTVTGGLMKFSDIARALGISASTVKNDYWRAVMKLAEASGLEPIEPPPSKYMGGHTQYRCRKCGEIVDIIRVDDLKCVHVDRHVVARISQITVPVSITIDGAPL